MRPRRDPIGDLLVHTGALTEAGLAEVLDHQRRALPLASLCYVLGYAGEERLVRVLSGQLGVPGLVLDQSVIRTELLQYASRELIMRHRILPVYEDAGRLFVAVEDPVGVDDVLRELQFVSGKTIVPHVALHVTLARTARACMRALEDGQPFLVGPLAVPADARDGGFMKVVSEGRLVEHTAPDVAPVGGAAMEDVTRELSVETWGQGTPPGTSTGTITQADDAAVTDARFGIATAIERPLIAGRRGSVGVESLSTIDELVGMPAEPRRIIDLDRGARPRAHPHDTGAARVLIVDDDFATRHLLVKSLQPLGFVTSTASSGGEAVHAIRSGQPDMVIIDAILPDMDGSEICRAIKKSRLYGHIAVVLMSAMLDAARITDEVLRRYGADAYFAKPLDTSRIKQRIGELLAAARAVPETTDDDFFRDALDRYQGGDIDAAIDLLRRGLSVDPLSAKHHFVLGNLLQKKALLYEAIDEYEATIELRPDYFPALTRLAYLYYKKGFSAKAIEIWRRSLPHCRDDKLRANIESFIRKLLAGT
ncbi:response regulator [Haliangium sp.]|uniref:response regulator n=1 Tax=Haliangium sp. TaxID=2663208 RepID=UPI003D0F963D